MDRRQIKTRAALFDALTTLLSKKRFSSITVQDIIDEANVGRSTFYSHFETKDDMLRAMCDEIFGHIFSEHPETCGYVSKTDVTQLEDRLAHILHHIRDSKYRVNEIISCESGEIFLGIFKEYMRQIFSAALFGAAPGSSTEKEMKNLQKPGIPSGYLTDFYASAFAETVRWWLSSPDSYTPEQTASFFISAAGL